MQNHLHDLNGEQRNQLLVLCDKKGKPQGLATREKCHKGNGKTHLAFMAFVFDREGKVILTKRSSKKSLWSGFWDASIVSHVLSGETPEAAAHRRGKEELGAEVDFKTIGEFYYFAKHGDSAENEYCYVLVGKTKEDMYPNSIEIEELKKMNVAELKKEILANEKEYTPWLKLALEKIDLSNIYYLVPEV